MYIDGTASTYHNQYSDRYVPFTLFSINMADTLIDLLLVKSDVRSDFTVPIAHVHNCSISGCTKCNGLHAKKSVNPL
jgi:hypothetical protein